MEWTKQNTIVLIKNILKCKILSIKTNLKYEWCIGYELWILIDDFKVLIKKTHNHKSWVFPSLVTNNLHITISLA